MLEATQHASSVFVTLTYDEAHCPADGSLRPDDTKRFLWRLRDRLRPVRFRYYLVGEYGDETWRPHYHVILFGLPVASADLIQKTWGNGFTSLYPLTDALAQYCAGYVVKKLTSNKAPQLLGRHPEFARMSLRPGLGKGAMEDVASALSDVHGARLISSLRDVPESLRRGRRLVPLGRYLRRKLREEVGFTETGTPDHSQASEARREELRTLSSKAIEAGTSLRKQVVEDQRILQLETRARIWRKKGTL